MAKRKSEIVVEPIVGNLYEAWMDKKIADKVRTMPGVQEVYERGTCGAPWGIKLDPRYDADEVIAEIEALGKPVQEEPVSLQKEARTLGRRVGDSGQLIYTIVELLRGAEESYAEGYYESALSSLITDIVVRLRDGGW